MGSGNSSERRTTQPYSRPQQIVSLTPAANASMQNPFNHQSRQGHRLSVQQTYVVKNPVNLIKGSLQCRTIADKIGFSFIFDALTDVEVTFYYGAREVNTPNRFECSGTSTAPRVLKSGLHQLFSTEEAENLPISIWERFYYAENNTPDTYDAIISLKAISGETSNMMDQNVSMQCTYITLSREDGKTARSASDTSSCVEDFKIKTLRQKVILGQRSFEVQEIYGIDRSGSIASTHSESDNLARSSSLQKSDISGRECVICLTEDRNTAVLPCRHMCLCSTCAGIMRMQSNKCPICRQHVHSLLQISVKQDQPGNLG